MGLDTWSWDKSAWVLIDLVGAMGQLDSGVQEHMSISSCTHLGDRTIPGGRTPKPSWRSREDPGRNSLARSSLEVLAAFQKGGRSHHRIAEDVESRLTVIFNRGLYQDEVSSMEVHLTESRISGLPLAFTGTTAMCFI